MLTYELADQEAGSLSAKTVFRDHMVVALTILGLWAITVGMATLAIRETDGHFVYPLDDAYIHMATAKHFSENLTWGVTPYAFSSSVSSISWPLMISAIYRLLGPNELVPLVLNGIIATVLLYLVHIILVSEHVRSSLALLILLAFLYLTPLPAMIISGQEHILHLLFCVLFIRMCAKTLAQYDDATWDKRILLLSVSAALLTASRYEGLFLVSVASLLFIIRRRFLVSALVSLSSLVPVSVYGLISEAHGWSFLPASVLLHGKKMADLSIQSFMAFTRDGLMQLISAGHIRFLLVLAVVSLVVRLFQGSNLNRGKFWHEHNMVLILFIGMTLLHVFFARMGAYYRYEAYIVGSGVLFLSLALRDLVLESWSLNARKTIVYGLCLVILLMFVSPVRLFSRASSSILYTPMACSNVFDQQYQMGLFLKTYYEKESVAANDIGAINFLADLKCCDLAGLANLDVFRSRLKGTFGTESIRSVAQQERVKIAILYDSWFTGKDRLPADWISVGHWSLQDNVAVGSGTITFYAIEPAQAELLRRQLSEFSDRLPDRVIQSGN